jgi:tetratricopeptide (TPR) repeat protein
LHDRLLDSQAGDVMKELVDAMQADANVKQQVRQVLQPNEKEPQVLIAKMCFYFANHALRQKNEPEARKLLEQAIENDNQELDVLIALYRLSAQEPARRAQLVEMIEAVVDKCRTAIDDGPDEPVNYNELAWLVANTEGDIDEAIQLSEKSVEMVRAGAVTPADFRRVGQYLDTLAHCYFAKKDFAAAVRTQSEAARLDPYSKAISRQLAVFEKARAEHEKGTGG